MSFAANGNVRLFFEDFGSPSNPALVLVNGLGNQCIGFRDEFCESFVERGYRVIRFDNRDVGLSSDCVDGYALSDMARDVVAVLDSLQIERAHVMGFSLGGMIVQTAAIDHSCRLLSATSVMSTTGDPDVGHPTAAARELLLRKGSTDRESAIEAHLAGQRTWGSPDHVEWDVQTWLAGEFFDRACRPDGVARQYQAARRDGSRTARLGTVSIPFLVLHGTADTLIDISGGRRTAEVVRGSRFVAIEGMGHDYPRHFWPRLVAEFDDFVRTRT